MATAAEQHKEIRRKLLAVRSEIEDVKDPAAHRSLKLVAEILSDLHQRQQEEEVESLRVSNEASMRANGITPD